MTDRGEHDDARLEELRDKIAELDRANEELHAATVALTTELEAKTALVERLNEEILARSHAQHALSDANAALDAVIASSPLPTVAFDDDERVTIWNEAAERLFGWEAHEVLGRPFPAVPEGGREEHRRLLANARQGVRLAGYETRRRTKDGRLVDVAVFTAPIVVGHQRARNYVAIYQNVTERLRIERMKSDMLGVVGHELRTPLTAILGFSELLASGREAGETRDIGERIHDRAVDLDRLVEELLEAADIQAGSVSIMRVTTDVAAMLRSVAEAADAPRGIRLDVTSDDGLPPIALDRMRFERVLLRLLHNAFKYSREGGDVRLWARRTAEGVRIGVTDEGVGIDPEDVGRVFDPFMQADMSSTRQFGGMGLGLYNARQVVEAHGGSIAVESRPGAGSTFVIELPSA